MTLLEDNHACANYNYILNIQTGYRSGAGTSAVVSASEAACFYLCSVAMKITNTLSNCFHVQQMSTKLVTALFFTDHSEVKTDTVLVLASHSTRLSDPNVAHTRS